MIQFLENNILDKNEQTLKISYQRTISIIFGNYPYVEDIHNLIIQIKNNLNKDMSYATNVKGGMTSFQHFLNNPIATKFLHYCINRHQTSNPELFKYFYERNFIKECWGNEIKENDNVEPHTHNCWHSILYLTKGTPLILPELNLKITPSPGDYYFFPPEILHYVPKNESKEVRYNLITNIEQNPNWKKNKEIQEICKK